MVLREEVVIDPFVVEIPPHKLHRKPDFPGNGNGSL